MNLLESINETLKTLNEAPVQEIKPNGGQFSRLYSLVQQHAGDLKLQEPTDITKWDYNNPNWQLVLNAIRRGDLYDKDNVAKQYSIFVRNLADASGKLFNGYIKLNNPEGGRGEVDSGFLKRAKINFNHDAFDLVPSNSDASLFDQANLNELLKKLRNSKISDPDDAKKKGINDPWIYDKDKTRMQSIEYKAGSNVRKDTVNATFIVACYIVKRLNKSIAFTSTTDDTVILNSDVYQKFPKVWKEDLSRTKDIIADPVWTLADNVVNDSGELNTDMLHKFDNQETLKTMSILNSKPDVSQFSYKHIKDEDFIGSLVLQGLMNDKQDTCMLICQAYRDANHATPIDTFKSVDKNVIRENLIAYLKTDKDLFLNILQGKAEVGKLQAITVAQIKAGDVEVRTLQEINTIKKLLYKKEEDEAEVVELKYFRDGEFDYIRLNKDGPKYSLPSDKNIIIDKSSTSGSKQFRSKLVLLYGEKSKRLITPTSFKPKPYLKYSNASGLYYSDEEHDGHLKSLTFSIQDGEILESDKIKFEIEPATDTEETSEASRDITEEDISKIVSELPEKLEDVLKGEARELTEAEYKDVVIKLLKEIKSDISDDDILKILNDNKEKFANAAIDKDKEGSSEEKKSEDEKESPEDKEVVPVPEVVKQEEKKLEVPQQVVDKSKANKLVTDVEPRGKVVGNKITGVILKPGDIYQTVDGKYVRANQKTVHDVGKGGFELKAGTKILRPNSDMMKQLDALGLKVVAKENTDENLDTDDIEHKIELKNKLKAYVSRKSK